MILEDGRVIATAEIGQLGTVLRVAVPGIAGQARAGQFVHVRAGPSFDPLLRRPYSFNRIDRASGEIELIVKALGAGGEWIASRREGDHLDLLGPLGSSFVIQRSTRNLLLVAGGTGIAPIPPSVEYVTTTEDGSFGIKGRVTDAILPLLEWADQACACGPWPMLAALGRLRDDAARAAATYPGRTALLETQIAVEQHMGCAMGVCRACVIVTADGNARVCREGPVFGLGDVAFAEGEPATVGVTS